MVTVSSLVLHATEEQKKEILKLRKELKEAQSQRVTILINGIALGLSISAIFWSLVMVW